MLDILSKVNLTKNRISRATFDQVVNQDNKKISLTLEHYLTEKKYIKKPRARKVPVCNLTFKVLHLVGDPALSL